MSKRKHYVSNTWQKYGCLPSFGGKFIKGYFLSNKHIMVSDDFPLLKQLHKLLTY